MPDQEPTLLTTDRLTAQFAIHHEHFGEEPVSMNNTFSKMLGSEEEPYVRRGQVGEEWTEVETSWVKDPGYIVIVNRTGSDLQVDPTKKEKDRMGRQIIEVCLSLKYAKEPPEGDQPCTEIPMGEPGIFQPSAGTKLFFRSKHEMTKFRLFVFPR